MGEQHRPVMAKECADYLITEPDGSYFDGTAGFGGHLQEFINRLGKDGVMIFTDTDEAAFAHCSEVFGGDSRVRGYKVNFEKIDSVTRLEGVETLNGVFADLGVSSYQLDAAEAGFSYRMKAPLDLRLDKTLPLHAADILKTMDAVEIADILYRFGEEKNSRRIAREIVQYRETKEITSTEDLAGIIKKITPPNFLNKTLSRVFQALRIYINDELGTLERFLKKSVNLLKPGGRLVILTYHSLEDRIVKELFREEAKGCICPPSFPICVCGKKPRLKPVTRKGLQPSEEEIELNSRARSAKLRCAERTND